MRAADPSRAFGAVLGKALRGLSGGRGLVPVLVSLAVGAAPMPELRQRASTSGSELLLRSSGDMFGFQRGVVPPDPVTGRVSVSLRRQLDALGSPPTCTST